MVGDSIAHLGWMYGRVNFKNVPKKPPRLIRRPGDISTGDMEAVRNLSERTVIVAGSLTFAELDAAIEQQTGAPKGIGPGKGV